MVSPLHVCEGSGGTCCSWRGTWWTRGSASTCRGRSRRQRRRSTRTRRSRTERGHETQPCCTDESELVSALSLRNVDSSSARLRARRVPGRPRCAVAWGRLPALTRRASLLLAWPPPWVGCTLCLGCTKERRNSWPAQYSKIGGSLTTNRFEHETLELSACHLPRVFPAEFFPCNCPIHYKAQG